MATVDMPEIDFNKAKILRRGRGSSIGRRIALGTLRISKGMTQTRFARRAKMSQGEVSRIEHQGDCLVSTLKRYAKALGGELCVIVRIDGRSYPIALVS
jgi:hypothetical protein